MNKMTFDEYQLKAATFASYPDIGSNYDYPLKGIVSEIGELAGKLKKIERDKGGVFTEDDIAGISKELGDSLWYLSAIANEFSLSLGKIAQQNIEKLRSRQERGVIGGSGDNR